jgi:transposase
MAKRRLSMRKIMEVLRLTYEIGLSIRQVARSCGIGRSTVQDYLTRAQNASLAWPLPDGIDEERLESLLFPAVIETKRDMTPFEQIHTELKKKGVTLMLLWQEYKERNPDGYQYTQFCDYYRTWAKNNRVYMRQHHKAGEKLFVDYAGLTIAVHERSMVRQAYLFVATMGASNYTYVEAVWSQDLSSWVSSHVNAFRFFNASPAVIVPDNLKAGVTHPCRYEPDINPTYQEMARHYGAAVIPARVRKPRDKAKVEVAVQIAERWIIASLRHHTFFSLGELNAIIRRKLIELNNRPLQKLLKTRREIFETIDKPAMIPLPEKPYEYAEWKKANVKIDYHVEVDRYYYSVPHRYLRKEVEIRITHRMIEVFFKGKRIASHERSNVRGAFTSLTEHMPESHKRYREWTPERIISWAGKNGPSTAALVRAIMERKVHPEQGYRSCLGIIRLVRHYGAMRVEKACDRALSLNACAYKSVLSILKTGLDGKDILMFTRRDEKTIDHPHIRGSQYYQQGEKDAHRTDL